MRDQITTEVAKSAPAVAVVTGPYMGLTISDTVGILTGIWVIVQLAYLVWKWHREARG